MNIQQFWSDVFAQRADEIRNTSTPMPAKRGNSSILDGLTRRGKQEDTSRKALKTLGKRQKYCLSTASRPPAALLSSASANRFQTMYLLRTGQVLFFGGRPFGMFRGCRASGERNAITPECRQRRHLRPSCSSVLQALIDFYST